MLSHRLLNRSWAIWKSECSWMSLYFFLGGGVSVWFMEAVPGVMSDQELDERVKLIYTLVIICSSSYFFTFAISKSISAYDSVPSNTKKSNPVHNGTTVKKSPSYTNINGTVLKKKINGSKDDDFLRDMREMSTTDCYTTDSYTSES